MKWPKGAAAVLMLAAALPAREYKAVFDCTASDPLYLAGRMGLIEKTMTQIEARGDKPHFVITMHSGCVKLASENVDFLVPDDAVEMMRLAQKSLERLSRRGVEIVACSIAMEGQAIDREDVLPFIRVTENSFIETIGYQNRGYALMILKK